MSVRNPSRRAGLVAILTAASAVLLSVVSLGGAQAKAPNTLTIESIQQTVHSLSGGIAIVDLDKTTGGKTIGADTLICLKAASSCATTVDLRGNDLFLQTHLTKTGAIGTVIDGTGRYAHAAGTVRATNATSKKATVTLTFS